MLSSVASKYREGAMRWLRGQKIVDEDGSTNKRVMDVLMESKLDAANALAKKNDVGPDRVLGNRSRDALMRLGDSFGLNILGGNNR
jgi:hypothetical protein